MNRIRPGRFCGICRADIAAVLDGHGGEYMFQAMRRQTDCGICDACQRARQAAAVEYESACDAVRVMTQMGADYPLTGRGMPAHGSFAPAMHRIRKADQRCVALKMWPATRPVPVPERSTTE